VNLSEDSTEIFSGCRFIAGLNHEDERGTFFRIAEESWLPEGFCIKQVSGAYNSKENTFRGLHFEKTMNSEYKFFKVTSGSLLDVLLDLRPDSKSYLTHKKFVIRSRDPFTLLIPPGIAHGYLTLEPDTNVVYGMSTEFTKENYQGIRFDDPKFDIVLPASPKAISEQDAEWPLWEALN
jgi:dTDP-4-dehydrorhamnose 3,5-epimerase